MQFARPNPRRPFADLHKSNPAAIDKPPELPQRNPQHPSRFSKIQQRLDPARFACVPRRSRFSRRIGPRRVAALVRSARLDLRDDRLDVRVSWRRIFRASIVTSHHAAKFKLRCARRVHDAAKVHALAFANKRESLLKSN